MADRAVGQPAHPFSGLAEQDGFDRSRRSASFSGREQDLTIGLRRHQIA
jgi:hypothetical protein